MTYTHPDEVVVVTDSNGNYRNATDWSKNQWMTVEEGRLLPKKDWKVFDGVESGGCMCSEANGSVDSGLKTVSVSEAESSVSTEKSPDKHIEALRELLKTRSEVGLKKYGVTLERKDLKPSEWAQHLLEELLDAAGYIHRLKEDLEAIERFWK